MKKIFGFRAEEETIKKWKLYAQAKNKTIESLGNEAIKEYIKNHPLTEQENKTLWLAGL